MSEGRSRGRRAASGAASGAASSAASSAERSGGDAGYRATLERAKRASTLQLLFRAARLYDEEALRRVAALPGRPRLRRAHTSLFPHIELEGTRITELAARLGVTKQAVSQLVGDLEGLGVLERAPDPVDARARLVRFTALGRAGLLDGLALLRALEAELERELGARRMSELRRALLALVDHAERGSAHERAVAGRDEPDEPDEPDEHDDPAEAT